MQLCREPALIVWSMWHITIYHKCTKVSTMIILFTSYWKQDALELIAICNICLWEVTIYPQGMLVLQQQCYCQYKELDGSPSARLNRTQFGFDKLQLKFYSYLSKLLHKVEITNQPSCPQHLHIICLFPKIVAKAKLKHPQGLLVWFPWQSSTIGDHKNLYS